MSGKQKSYLENQLEAVAEKTDAGYTFTFQREKIKLLDGLEANVIKDINPFFHKEIDVTDDEVIITIQPPSSYKAFRFMKAKDKKSKWQFAYQLVQAVQQHNLSRLNLIVAPENIVFDKGLTPYFLHYGVKESIPPYERDEERVWQELKAAAALAVDGAFAFEDYLKFNETLTFSAEAKAILDAESYDDLLELIQTHIDELEAKAKTYIHIPRKKWNIQRYIGLGLIVLLVPALIYSMYALFFAQPKHQVIVDSNRAFLNKQYSEVISTLSKYDAESLPESVQYQLATSYVEVENLGSAKTKNIENNLVTLQSDPQHFLYWIDYGRGEYKEAISIGRKLEYNDYIYFALAKYKQQLLSEDTNDEDIQKELDSVNSELEKAQKERQENKQSNSETSLVDTSEEQTQTDEEKQAEEKVAEEKATAEEKAKKEEQKKKEDEKKETEKKDEKKDDK
ncbi:type VII secretion protein EssB [Bacillus subtilis]|uniref:type VII secretion protein EssB n=1 Tax=Bacillus TaxID=1386 RepID=UPI000D98D60C|nr:type VII secretion protein EssB [Bacillus subtilis]MEC2268490.1 type VII secretion protein EssB [Bacillus subtilis]MED3673098.1 type VII secretion protein EssB [Bacillus subtilis]MED4458226.1 type VII secretion protein EssB [Bacillus subtilis]CAF1875720.1 ESAT-6 secretion machinery protein EssB [Bacillus subtilis]SPY15235.1 type VII secretion protein EssB [Bacillus subtilis]